MIKKLLNNQSGFSLAMAIVAFMVVSSGTWYLMDISRQNRVSYVKARATTSVETERKRLTTVLADNANCTYNFSGKANGDNFTSFSLVYKNSTSSSFLASGYQSTTKLTLTRMNVTFNSLNPNSGLLNLWYENLTNNVLKSGKHLTKIQIPLYVKLNGSVISECYAITENQNVGAAVQASCAVGTNGVDADYQYEYGNYNQAYGVTNTCSVNFKFTQVTESNCATAPGPGAGYAFRGFEINDVSTSNDIGRIVEFPTATKCGGFVSSNTSLNNCSANAYVYSITGGQVSCAIPGGSSRDTSLCSGGQLLNKTSSTAVTCTTIGCAGTSFLNAFSTAGPSCYSANTYSCPAGYYARGFASNGTPDCAPFPVMSGSCAAGNYGISFTRSGSTNGTINCSAYTKTKSCPTYTYLSSLTSTGGTNCTAY